MIPLATLKAHAVEALDDASSVDEERQILESVAVAIADELMQRAEQECPGFEAFVNWTMQRESILAGKKDPTA